MKLQITQCSVGKFNYGSDEETLSFYLVIKDDDNKVIEVDGVKAILCYSGDPDAEHEFTDLNNLDFIFTKCFDYVNRIWSTIDYKAQCLTFAKVYQDNYKELNAALVEKEKEELQKEIIKLQLRLQRLEQGDYIIPDLTYSINESIDKKINGINKTIEYNEKELSQLKEDSEKYKERKANIEKYNSEIEELQKHKAKEIA